jgi:hypothetical protein
MIVTVPIGWSKRGYCSDAEVAVPSEEHVERLISVRQLANPPHDNPPAKQLVQDWITHRVAQDEQMRSAGAARKAQEKAQQEGSG